VSIKDNILDALIIICIILFAGLSWVCYGDLDRRLNEIYPKLLEPGFRINISKNSTGYRDIIFNCAYANDLKESVRCLNNEIKQIYSYNITNDSLSLSFDELKQRGGDCKDWTESYAFLARKLGFNTTGLKIRSGPNSAHVFLIIYNEEGYCTIDQTQYSCFKYGGR